MRRCMVNQAYSRCVVFRRTFFPRHLYLSRMLLRDSKVIRNYREKYELRRMEKVKSARQTQKLGERLPGATRRFRVTRYESFLWYRGHDVYRTSCLNPRSDSSFPSAARKVRRVSLFTRWKKTTSPNDSLNC